MLVSSFFFSSTPNQDDGWGVTMQLSLELRNFADFQWVMVNNLETCSVIRKIFQSCPLTKREHELLDN